MAKSELGTKRECPSCTARFYDLGKNPVACPKCGFEFEPEALLKPKRARAETAPAASDEAEKEDVKSEAEVPLEDADKEIKTPESKKAAGLDEENDDEDDGEDIEFELEDDDDESLLEAEDDGDEDEMMEIASGEEQN